MKKIAKSILMLISIVPLLAFASEPREVEVPVVEVYAPAGFDSNDSVEVMVAGYLPNLCYRNPRSEFKVVGREIQVTMKSLYGAPKDMLCAEVLVPYLEKVQLGVFNKGNYKIKIMNKVAPVHTSALQVTESRSSAIDENIYAAVEYVEKTYGTRKVALKGYNPSDCLELKEIKFASNKLNTLSVLPIMKKVRSHCPRKMVEFSYEFEVPTHDLKSDKILLHVRSMDGKSVNTLYTEDYYSTF